MPILIIGALLIIIWILAIYSVSIHESFTLTLTKVAAGVLSEPSNYFYFNKHIINIVIALGVALITYKIPLKFFKKYNHIIFILAVVFQMLVFTKLWLALQGAKGWLYLGFTTIQPSEFFKLAFVIFFAGWLVRKKHILGQLPWYLAFLAILWLSALIFLAIPDLWTLLVLIPLAFVMMRYGGGKIKHLAGILVVCLCWGVFVGMQFTYIKSRLLSFVNPDADKTGKGISYQINQSLIAVGAGGIFGKWYGKGLQKFGYIPEAQSDFIFAAFSEEIGFIGNMVLLSLYFFLAYKFIKRLPEIKDEYSKNLWAGIISLLIIQMFVNIGVNIQLLPLTWLTLPFISAWWSALMVNVIELILLYKIAYKNETL